MKLLRLSLLCVSLGLLTGCGGGGPDTASERDGMMDDMSQYDAPVDPASLSGQPDASANAAP